METKSETTAKQIISARYWLLGMAENDEDYYHVIQALEMGREHHNGTRNDGSPEFSHQVAIFHHLRTLHRHIVRPAIVYALVFLHDILEDKNQRTGALITPEQVHERLGGGEFASIVVEKLCKISKTINDQPTDYNFDAIFADQELSVVKFGDRCHNVSTMYGAFKRARLIRYIRETRDTFMSYLAPCRRRFPYQEGVYENVKLMLTTHLDIIEACLEAATEQSTE